MSNQTVDDKLNESNLSVDVLESSRETPSSNSQIQSDAVKDNEVFFQELFKNIMNGGNSSLYSQFCWFAYSFLRNLEDTEDVVQNAMVTIYRYRNCYDMKRPFRPWAFTILANSAKDYLRKKGRNRKIPISQLNENDPGRRQDDYEIRLDEIAATTLTPEEIYSIQQDCIRVREALAHLKEEHREIIELVYFKKFSYDQTSVILNIPVGTVKSRLHSAVENLQELFLRKESLNSAGLRDYAYSRGLELVAKDAEKISAAIWQLKPKHRQVLLLHYISGLSYGQISERLALPLGTAKYWVGVGRNQLFELCNQQSLNYPRLLHNLFYKTLNKQNIF